MINSYTIYIIHIFYFTERDLSLLYSVSSYKYQKLLASLYLDEVSVDADWRLLSSHKRCWNLIQESIIPFDNTGFSTVLSFIVYFPATLNIHVSSKPYSSYIYIMYVLYILIIVPSHIHPTEILSISILQIFPNFYLKKFYGKTSWNQYAGYIEVPCLLTNLSFLPVPS